MISSTAAIVAALAYLGILFAIAWYGDRRAKMGRSLIRSPFVYTLSLGVDDYVTKPFSNRDVVDRVRALLAGQDQSHGA